MSDYGRHFKKLKNNAVSPKVKPGVRSRVKAKKTHANRRARKELPLSIVISCFVLLVITSWLYLNVDKIEELVSKVEINFMGLAMAQQEPPKKVPPKIEKKEKPASAKSKAGLKNKRGIENLSSEELALFNKLEERKHKLDIRESELNKLEAELQKQKQRLGENLVQLKDLRRDIASQLKNRVEVDQSRVSKLVNFYSNMKPANAARVFETINEDLAVEVLKKMKKKNAASIMNLVQPKKARRLSEMFAGYRKR